MKSLHNLLWLFLTFFALTAGVAQSNFINYQGLVNDNAGVPLANQSVTIDLDIRFGMATSTPVYEETHTVTTDANGVFSIQIGNGTPSAGNYNTLIWGLDDAFVTTSVNGIEVGTTEFNAVPFALNTLGGGDSFWNANGNNIYNNNTDNVGIGTSTPGAKFMVKGTSTNPTLNIVTSTGTVPSLRVNDNGRVGIGTATPNEELEVNGDVMANSFIAPGMTYADYVFEAYYNGISTINENYRFNSLEQIESYIKDNGHIEGYKSIKELKKDSQGRFLINVNEQSNTNQEKIEELFLHTIDLNKQIKTQQKEIEELKILVQKLLSDK